jgi:hypothetical protein
MHYAPHTTHHPIPSPHNTTQHTTPHTRSSSRSRCYLLCPKRNFRVPFSIFTNLTKFPCFAFPFFDSPSTHGSSRLENMVCHCILLSCSLRLDFYSLFFVTLLTYPPTHPPTYLPTFLPTYLPIYLFIYLPAFLPTHLSTNPPAALPITYREEGQEQDLIQGKEWNGMANT